MEINALPALVAALANTPLAPLIIYIPLIIATAAVFAAILPVPAVGSPWTPARKLMDMVAMNVGSARNLPKDQ